MVLLLFILILILAFANGANDVSKGIATLVGSGLANFRRAVLWGALWTVAGGMIAALAARKLAEMFSGNGLLAATPEGHAFLASVAIGATAWVLFASRTGLPVSTTHAITGALCGAGVMAAGVSGVHWSVVGQKFLLPLAASPVIALAMMWLLFPVVRFAFAPLNNYCVCLEQRRLAVVAMPAVPMTTVHSLTVDESSACAASPGVVSRLNLMDSLHWLSSAAASFARGLNDAPKILALGAVAGGGAAYALVAAAMGVGSLVGGLRVTETLAQKVTPMNPTEGFAANLITSLLVGAASVFGLPVSTTHVSSGAILGIGIRTGGRGVRWDTMRHMLLAWLVTLPVAALLAVVAYGVMR